MSQHVAHGVRSQGGGLGANGAPPPRIASARAQDSGPRWIFWRKWSARRRAASSVPKYKLRRFSARTSTKSSATTPFCFAAMRLINGLLCVLLMR